MREKDETERKTQKDPTKIHTYQVSVVVNYARIGKQQFFPSLFTPEYLIFRITTV